MRRAVALPWQVLRVFARKGAGLVGHLNPRRYFAPPGSRYSLADLEDLDSRYRVMHELHRHAHLGLIREIQDLAPTEVLEVACGTGWNVPHFRAARMTYYGLDISETALATAALKYPEHRYLNLGITDCRLIKDESFDVVYNSSMLEHIGCYREAILEMVRIAKRAVYILFFEGLSDAPDNDIRFHPYEPRDVSGEAKDIFGRKVVLQHHLHEDRRGWYWNRYARRKVLEVLAEAGLEASVLDTTNRPYLKEESVVVIRKTNRSPVTVGTRSGE
jgi:SAM-dependent methyltransferase